ncbi:hypothetical protein [Bradyrhizobium sp. STM 3557]|uniref:hypothetical protein n=1 Tax=Bradyrhizobium sp. STM 3557 TaxID=578920 RepID=UPI00388FF2D4
MADITAADQVRNSDPGTSSGDTPNMEVQNAFQNALANFMLAVLQGAESDLVSAINDNTSDPDAAG